MKEQDILILLAVAVGACLVYSYVSTPTPTAAQLMAANATLTNAVNAVTSGAIPVVPAVQS